MHTSSVLGQFEAASSTHQKLLATLIDPDKVSLEQGMEMALTAQKHGVDWIMVGGSLMRDDSMNTLVPALKQILDIPVVLFPGSPSQIVDEADAIMLLSLISGRNSDLLIGKHVEAASRLKKSPLEVIPTGYMLIESGKLTTVNYVSNTLPIPHDKPDIAMATALAGELLGLKMVYMDGGSGAQYSITSEMIKAVKEELSIPLIIGGGIRTLNEARRIWQAGADMIVVGSAFERDPEGEFIKQICECKAQIHA